MNAVKKRYEPLGDFLRELNPSKTEITLSFEQIEKIIGHALPKSASKHHHQWWANQAGGSRAPHWRAAGFKVANVNFPSRLVHFERIAQTTGIILQNPNLQDVVSAINEYAHSRLIGTLQEWRKKHRGQSKTPSRTLFYSSIKEDRDWAFHAGGLSELQFNVGFEKAKLRHGVAFSLQTTREMPTIEPLIPKIERFNEYLRIYPNAFTGLSMWHFESGKRSADYAVSQISDERIRQNMFIFIGTLQDVDKISIDWILEDFDHFLPLYKYVEGIESFPKNERIRKAFVWTPGNKARVTRTSYERASQSIDKQLRHNIIQPALFDYLVEIHGKDNVSGEQNSGNGTSIDVAVREGKRFTYYEIKTGLSAQSCIREAMGQLLEYAYWPGNQIAAKLVIIGEAEYDTAAKSYIKCLGQEFSLPIEYKRFDMKTRGLI